MQHKVETDKSTFLKLLFSTTTNLKLCNSPTFKKEYSSTVFVFVLIGSFVACIYSL